MSAWPASGFLLDLRGNQLTPPSAREGQRDAAARAKELAEAYERGIADGRRGKEIETLATLEQQKEAFNGVLEAERREWAEKQATDLAECLKRGLHEVEQGICDSVGAVLRPFLGELALERTMTELGATLKDCMRDGDALQIRGSAPSELIAALCDRRRFPDLPEMQLQPEGCDIRLTIGNAIIESRLSNWIDEIRKAVS